MIIDIIKEWTKECEFKKSGKLNMKFKFFDDY